MSEYLVVENGQMHFIYILYSKKLNKHYVGETYDVALRLDQHNQGFYDKNNFTKKGQPWELVFQLRCSSKTQAKAIETHIKKMKSKKYLQNFIQYKEIQEKLLSKY